MTETDIVKRLRAQHVSICDDAAAYIERLRRKDIEHRRSIAGEQKRNKALADENSRLRKSL